MLYFANKKEIVNNNNNTLTRNLTRAMEIKV